MPAGRFEIEIQKMSYRGFTIEQERDGSYSIFNPGYVAGHFSTIEAAKDRLAYGLSRTRQTAPLYPLGLMITLAHGFWLLSAQTDNSRFNVKWCEVMSL